MFNPPRTRLHQISFDANAFASNVIDANAFASIFKIFKIHFFALYALWIPEISIQSHFMRIWPFKGSKWGFGKIKKKKKNFFFALNRYFWSFEVKLSDNFFLKILKILKFITPTCPQGAPWRSYDPKCV